MRPGKPGKVMDFENRPKSHGIVMGNRENFGQKLKMFKLIKYQVFPKNGLWRIPPHIL
jgi:hypothetical protein